MNLELAVENYKASTSELEDSVNDKDAIIHDLQDKIAGQNVELAEYKQSHSALSAELNETKNDAFEKAVKITDLTSELETANKSIEKYKNDLASGNATEQEKIDKLNSKIIELEHSLNEANENVDRLESMYAIKDIEGVKCLNASVIKFSDLLESISDQNIEFPEDEISRFIFVFKDPESEDYIRDIDDQIICCNRVNGCRLDKLDIQITSYDKEDSDDEEDESNNEGNNEEEEESK